MVVEKEEKNASRKGAKAQKGYTSLAFELPPAVGVGSYLPPKLFCRRIDGLNSNASSICSTAGLQGPSGTTALVSVCLV
ncbi:hypothetical protein B0H19DRAFT_202131 [Mycena capillaripes]|nr:hypothetical protein B0H19DRAFT_202131 [Mycena capillaripes]